MINYENLSYPSQSNKLEPIFPKTQNASAMQVDDVNPLLNGSDHSLSTASSSTTKLTQCRGIMSPTRRRMKVSNEKIGKKSGKESPNEDASMSETSSGINSSLSKHDDMVDPMNLYAMSQLGEPDPTAISKHDLLSAMSFDRTGDILSVGDRGGRVICFHLQDDENGVRDYEYLTEFQAHQKNFDVLSSSEISETVTSIEWINSSKTTQPAMLTSNSRQVKLFRIVSKYVKKSESIKKKIAKGKGLCIPKTRVVSESKEGKHIATFNSGKEQHLHSISLSPEQDSFITADENRINLWNLDYSGQHPIYNLMDFNRQKSSEGDELITSGKFSEQSPMFLYTTTKGHLRICDLRESSNFQKRASIQFQVQPLKSARSFDTFDEWLNVISQAQFIPGNPNYVLSRDYLTCKLWDLRKGANRSSSMLIDQENATKPVYNAQVTDYLSRNLVNLLDNDQLDDRFFLSVSPNGKYFATGGYNKSGHVIDMNATMNSSIVCKFDQARDTAVGSLKVYGKNKRLIQGNNGINQSPGATAVNSSAHDKASELRKRVSMGAWKPVSPQDPANQQTLALVFRNCIYLYNGKLGTKKVMRTPTRR